MMFGMEDRTFPIQGPCLWRIFGEYLKHAVYFGAHWMQGRTLNEYNLILFEIFSLFNQIMLMLG